MHEIEEIEGDKMINIAICDDEQAILQSYKARVKAIFDNKGIETTIRDYKNGNQLIQECMNTKFDLIFLDIDMPKITGFDVACKVNEINEDCLIIFVTNEEQLVYRSLRYNPFRFIRKAYLVTELNEAIISFLDVYLKKNKSQLFNCTNGDLIAVNIKDLIYVESNKHKVIVYTKKGILVTKAKISELAENLRELGFIRVHIGYLVNMRFINSVEKSEVVLDNKERIPLSRHRAEQVKIEFQKFIRGDY